MEAAWATQRERLKLLQRCCDVSRCFLRLDVVGCFLHVISCVCLNVQDLLESS